MQKYGLILADAGRPWFLTGEASAAWESLLGANLTAFRNDIASITAVNMEVVQPPGTLCCLCASHTFLFGGARTFADECSHLFGLKFELQAGVCTAILQLCNLLGFH
jgi:hypothetical protein